MMDAQKNEAIAKVIVQERFPPIREEAVKLAESFSTSDLYPFALSCYDAEEFQVQELGVFLFGLISHAEPQALHHLQNVVSENTSFRMQEIFAYAVDIYCKSISYENSLPMIKAWLRDSRPNVRRAIVEGLRVWTSRPYFIDNPVIAVTLLSSLRADPSEYVRKSVGNALKDISITHPDLIKQELATWNTSNPDIAYVYKLAYKFFEVTENAL